MNAWSQHLVRDPQICGGETVFRGTRVTLRVVLGSLEEGDTAEHILAEFPSLTREHLRAAIAFAAAAAKDDLPPRDIPPRDLPAVA